MIWLGWLLVLFVAYWFLSDLLRSKRCHSHGVFGRCRCCEAEAAARVEAEAEAEHQRMAIEESYGNMDQARRDELTTLVKARAQAAVLDEPDHSAPYQAGCCSSRNCDQRVALSKFKLLACLCREKRVRAGDCVSASFS